MPKYIKKMSIEENGEIVDEKVYKLYSPFMEGKGYNFKYKSINIKSYLDIALPDDFTDAEIGRTHRLSRAIYSDSNLLARRSNNEIKPLNKQDIQEIIGIHRNNFAKYWRKILKNKIIKLIPLGKSDFYCFNPIYFNSTTYLPIYLFIGFQEELKNHLPEWVIKKYLDMREGEKEEKKASG